MFDAIIIGGGPAGLTAGIYTRRAKLDVMLIEKMGIGGQIALSDIIENYPGFPTISGFELMSKFEEHARNFDLKIEYEEVKKVEKTPGGFLITTTEKNLESRSIIVASGASPKKLGVTGEEKYIGKGISYCATCDGPFFAGKEIAVVGGGDTAVKEAIFLSKMAKNVYIIHRRGELRAEKIIQEKAFNASNVNFIWDSIVEKIEGDDYVKKIFVKNLKSGIITEILADGVFIFVGILPNTGFLNVNKDDIGFIITDENLGTSVEGIFAAGDCRVKTLRQVSTAVGDGALAAYSVEKYLEL